MRKLLILCSLAILYFSSGAQPIAAQATGKSGLFKQVTFKDKQYFVCTVDPRKYKIELFNRLMDSHADYNFNTIAATKKKELLFAMNGGMFEQDFKPVGLFVANGKTYNPLNIKDGNGNFYDLKPNGVFIIDKNNKPIVLTTEKFASGVYNPQIGTQSGPMLVIDGTINSNFKENSVNLNIRNAVGVTKDNQVVFVVSIDKINFYELSQLFRDMLGCDNALYLDGFISQYYAPELQSVPISGVPLGLFITVSKSRM